MSDTSFPRDILVSENIRDKYLRPINDIDNKPFKDITDIYLMAAVFGLKNKMRIKSVRPKSIRQFRDLSDEQKLIMNTIAATDKEFNTDILLPENAKEMFKIVEEYANAGASLLHDKVMIKRDNKATYEDMIWEEIKKISAK